MSGQQTQTQNPQRNNWQRGQTNVQRQQPRMGLGRVSRIPKVEEIPEDVAQWTTQMLRVLGWNSKREDHAKLHEEIGTLLKEQPDTPLVKQLRRDYEELSTAFQINQVWDSTQEMRASEIKATLLFESMPNQRPELQSGSANPTFWVKGKPDPGTGETKEYLFKPGVEGRLMSGMPSGGEPGREALTGRIAEQLKVFTGLDFNMPLTNLISVDPSRMEEFRQLSQREDHRGGKIVEGERITGSLQQFKPSKGDLRSRFFEERSNITPQDCQKITILDTVILNLDRHDGNLLLGKDDNSLIPIDHGLGFPTFETVRKDDLERNISSEKNALLRLPNAYEPFSEESLEGIESIDPDLMTSALIGEHVKMGQLHPEIEETVSPESFTLVNLSTKFLKKAARRLPPAVLQIALAAEGKRLLDPAMAKRPEDWDELAESVIAEYAQKVPALKEFWMLPGDEREAIYKTLKDNRLLPDHGIDDAWVARNVELILSFYRAGKQPEVPPRPQVPRPNLSLEQAQQEAAGLGLKTPFGGTKRDERVQKWNAIRRLGDVNDIRQALLQPEAPKRYKTLDDVLQQVKTYVAARDNRQRSVKLQTIYQLFPDSVPPEWKDDKGKYENELIGDWDLFLANGGTRALREAKQLHPDAPEPRDPRAALLMILAPQTTPDQAALKTLDYLDTVVQCDPEAVSQDNQARLQMIRTGIENAQLQGQEARQSVAELADDIIAEGVRRFRRRLNALKPKLDERLWKVQVEEALLPLLLTGKLVDFAPNLRVLEEMAK